MKWIIMLTLILAGCSNEQPTRPTAQQYAQQKAELEKVRSDGDFWQVAACLLVSGTIIALIVGAAIGSKAKEDADEQ